MHTDSQKKRRTLLLLVLLLSTVMLFDALMIFNRQEPQTYQSRAAAPVTIQSPLNQNSLQSSYLIDELFDMTDADHAEIIDELIKELQGNASALEKADGQLSASLERANYDGASQALVNLQQGLRDTGWSFAGAISLLDYHLAATPSATPAPIPPVDNPENKQVLGVADDVKTVADRIDEIEDSIIKEINRAKQSITHNKKSIEDANNQINSLSTKNNNTEIKNFCDSGKQKFLSDLTADQNNLTVNIALGKTKQNEAISAYDTLMTEVHAKIDQIDTALKSIKNTTKKTELLGNKVVLLDLKKKIEDNKSSPPVVNDLDINDAVLTNYKQIITTTQNLISLMCGQQEETEVRQALNNMISDLSRIQGDINTVKTNTEKITQRINNLSAQMPQIKDGDDKLAILTKLIAANNLLLNVSLTLQDLVPLVHQQQGLGHQLESIKKTFTALQKKYQSNTNLQADITKASEKIAETERSLTEADTALKSVQQAGTGLITAINNLITELNKLLAGVSEELQKPEESEADEPQRIDKNKDCIAQDLTKDERIYKEKEDLNCVGKKIGDSCGYTSDPKTVRYCRRVGVQREPVSVGGLPLSFSYKNLRLGVSKKKGVVCACKKDNPNQTWVGVRSLLGAWGGNAAALSYAAYWGYGQLTGGGDEGSRPIPQGEDLRR